MGDIPPYSEDLDFKAKIPLLTTADDFDDEVSQFEPYQVGGDVLKMMRNFDVNSTEYREAQARVDEYNKEIKEENRKRYNLIRDQGYDPKKFTVLEMLAAIDKEIVPANAPDNDPDVEQKNGTEPVEKVDVWGVSKFDDKVKQFKKKEGIESFDQLYDKKTQKEHLPTTTYTEEKPDEKDVEELLYLFELFNGQDTYSHERITIGPLRRKEFLVIPPDFKVPIVRPSDVMTKQARAHVDMRHFFQIAYLNSKVFEDALTDGNKDIAAGFVRAFIVQDGWLDPSDLYEVRRAESEEMPKKADLQAFKKRIVNSKDENVVITSGSVIIDIEKCSKIAKLIPMAAELVFRTRGHHFITELADEYKQAYGNILKACLASDIITYFPPNYLFHKLAHFVSVSRAYDVIQSGVDTNYTEVPRAIQIRAGATPAGTAVICSSVAVLAQMKNKFWWDELYKICKNDIDKIQEMNELIKSNPKKWHINNVAYRSPRLSPGETTKLEKARVSASSLAPIVQAYITATVDSSRGTVKSSLVGIKAINKYAQTDAGLLRAMTSFFKRSFTLAGKADNLTDLLGRMSKKRTDFDGEDFD